MLGLTLRQKEESRFMLPAGGWAISSYHNRPVKEKDGSIRIYKEKPISMGLGYFIQIYHPENKRYTQYGHLEKIVKKIPFATPRKRKDSFYPYGYKIRPGDIKNSKYYVWVNQGELIGYVGDSGLCWGYKDYPQRPDSKKYPSWDEIHLHFEEFSRDKKGKKIQQRDPFNLYKTYQHYPKNIQEISKNTLWKDYLKST